MVRGVNALPSAKASTARPRFGVTHVEVRGFRSARDVAFSPGSLCVLVGEADAGKSNLLAAIRAVLDPAAAPLTAADVHEGGDGDVSIRVRLADGNEATLEGTPLKTTITRAATAPPVLFLPAAERAGGCSRRARTGGAHRRPESSSSCSPGRARRRRRTPSRGPRRGRVLLLERSRRAPPPDRGTGALSPPAGAAAHLPRSARAHPRREPGHLHDALARVPQRRPAGRARLRRPLARHGYARPPAGAGVGGRGLSRDDRVRHRPQRALPRPRGRPRRGPDREARAAVRVLGARVRRRPGGDLDRRVRRQAESAPCSRGSVARPASPSSSCTTATGRRAAGSSRPSRR